MPRAARQKSSTDIYHVILRGINRQRIFEEDEDYRMFLRTLQNCREQSAFSLYAWCLMPNHIHLLLKEGRDPLSNVFRRIGAGFVKTYNRKYNRTGHLFEDRYLSEAVEYDSYFLTVMRYIHLNPVKAGLCQSPEAYPYSSYSRFFNKDLFPENRLIYNLISVEEFEQYHMEKNEDICLDIEGSGQKYLTDVQLFQKVQGKILCRHLSEIQNFPSPERDRAIEVLLRAGGSYRQISRLTGVSTRTIQSAAEELKKK